MFVIKNKNIFFALSGILALLSIVALFVWGLRFSIDFTGGSILEVSYSERPEMSELQDTVGSLGFASFSVRPTGNDGYIIRSEPLSEDEHQELQSALGITGEAEARAEEVRFSSIGPTIGEELQRKAYVAIAVVVVAIILFITFVFRKVSRPVSSWKYGLVAIAALIHDILIPTGVFALLGAFVGVEIDILFVMALLAILGFSVNDTIVVFDRIRENLYLNQEKNVKEPFSETVGKSLSQTYTRSLNTSITTLLVLLALLFLGGASTQMFALVLVIGVVVGTYSSIFLASPLLVKIARLRS